MAAESELTQQQQNAMATSVLSNVNVDVAATVKPCPDVPNFSGTTVGLEYECSIKAISSTQTSILFTSAARANSVSDWRLVAVTRDISQVSGSVASGTLEFVTGPIEAHDELGFRTLFDFLENFFKQWKTGERDAAIIAAMMKQDNFAVAGIATPDPEKAKPVKKKTKAKDESDDDRFSSDESEDEVDMQAVMKRLREPAVVKPRFEGDSSDLCGSTPQVNLGVQLDVLGADGSKAAALLKKEFDPIVHYPEILQVVDSYLNGLKLGGNLTFRGIIVLYAMITNVFAQHIREKPYESEGARENILSGAWVNVSDVAYKNGWNALPKVEPWKLWRPAENELRERYWSLLKGSNLNQQSQAFAEAFCSEPLRPAAAAVFAALAVGTISPNAMYAAFSAAPKPVDPFLIRSRLAIVIELRGSTQTTQGLAIHAGNPTDPEKVTETLRALAAIAI